VLEERPSAPSRPPDGNAGLAERGPHGTIEDVDARAGHGRNLGR
jgi:hypothetical protein